ncbi:hypothetical protein OCGS_0793 [Oceaniovalibus guishaninsula JLT2003]|uniref:diguanylate cyclase n=1 Tax=Oceaniovalibus guishaninsula JLT2003 TaxID=1231392 RepID=K2HCC5_9RHOB|nr:diguanylate cyclase [Oceaniovalibus guishaninsula]EKE45098.1 hypothetical protein OCGS_0793 [Oceaniovalibus guishaninsula JLT2003]
MSRRILIVDDLAINRIALRSALGNACYDVHAVADGATAMKDIAAAAPDLVIAAQDLPDMSGTELCRRIVKTAGNADLPVILIGATQTPDARLAALEAGAATLISRPSDRAWLLANLRSVLRAAETRGELRRRDMTASRLGFSEAAGSFDAPARIAFIGSSEESAATADALRHRLQHDIAVIPSSGALSLGDDRAPPDVVVLADTAPADEMLWLLSELRSRPQTRRSAILIGYDQDDRTYAGRALDLGASDLFETDADPQELALRIARQVRLKRDADRLRATVDAGLAMAARDSLTGLYNRRYALHHLAELAARPRLEGRGYGVLILDIDRFKAVNDRHGHAAGDAVLSDVARQLSDNIRDVDLIARIGGEEFLVALSDTSPSETALAAERLRLAIADRPAILPDGRTLPVSVSIGATCAMGGPVAPQRALDAADVALYEAKRAGRNRVVLAAIADAQKPSRTAADEAPLRRDTA